MNVRSQDCLNFVTTAARTSPLLFCCGVGRVPQAETWHLQGIAKRLIRTALERVAKRIDVKYAELERLGVGQRRNLHDDITVVVVFFKPFPKVRTNIRLKIVKGGEDAGSAWGTEPPSPKGNLRLHTTKNRLMHSLACSCCMVDD